MPSYDYRCDSNGRVVEVSHRMNEQVATWGELCERAGITPGRTPASAPVRKLITGGSVISAGNAGSTERPCDYGGPTAATCGSCACNPE